MTTSTPAATKPTYGIERRDGSIRAFPSKAAALRFDRDLPPLALQYKQGVLVSNDGGGTWEPFAR